MVILTIVGMGVATTSLRNKTDEHGVGFVNAFLKREVTPRGLPLEVMGVRIWSEQGRHWESV